VSNAGKAFPSSNNEANKNWEAVNRGRSGPPNFVDTEESMLTWTLFGTSTDTAVGTTPITGTPV